MPPEWTEYSIQTMKNRSKEELKQQALLHQQALEKDFDDVVTEGKKTAKKVAIVAGSILVSYLVVRALTRKKVVVKDAGPSSFQASSQKSGMMGMVGKMLLTEAAVLGVKFAKERIKDYFEHSTGSDEHSEDA